MGYAKSILNNQFQVSVSDGVLYLAAFEMANSTCKEDRYSDLRNAVLVDSPEEALALAGELRRACESIERSVCPLTTEPKLLPFAVLAPDPPGKVEIAICDIAPYSRPNYGGIVCTFTITSKAAALEFRDAFLGAAEYLESLS